MLYIRPFKKSDADYAVNWIRDEKSMAFWGLRRFTYPLTKEQLITFSEEINTMNNMQFITAVDENNKAVGCFTVKISEEIKNNAHLGFIVIDPDKRGRGYGKEMVQIGIDYSFSIAGIDNVTINVFENNIPARKCYESIGFKEIEHIENAMTFKEELWAVYKLRIDRKDRKAEKPEA